MSSRVRLKNIRELVLYSLIVLGIGLRLWQFGSNPVSLNRDEAALAYNAWSIAHFGVDEWNRSYPFVFESFGDYKLPGYIYLTSVLFHFSDSEDVVVRLPSLVAGMVIILITYLLSKKIYDSKLLGLGAAAITALAPWAIFYSRMAWEANVALMWLLIAIYLFLQKAKLWNYFFVFVCLVAAVSTYNTPLLLLPVLIGFILLHFNKPVKERLIYTIIFVVVGLGASVVLLPVNSQKQAISIFSDPTTLQQQKDLYVAAANPILRMYNSSFIYSSRLMIKHMVQSFGWDFLVFHGGANPWYSVPGRGHLFLGVFVLFLIGFCLMLASLVKKQWKWLPWVWLTFGSLAPAIITVDAPHATRSLLFLWLIGLIAAYALMILKKLFWLLVFTLTIECIIFIQGYFLYFPQHMNQAWPVGLRESLKEAESKTYESGVYITNSSESSTNLLSEYMYIFPLLYSRTQPGMYQSTVVQLPRNNVGLIQVAGFANFMIESDPTKIPDEAIIIERDTEGTYAIME